MSDSTIYLSEVQLFQIAAQLGVPWWTLTNTGEPAMVMARNERDINDIAYRMGGRARKETEPVMLIGPDGTTPVLVATDSDTEAGALQDLVAEMHAEEQDNVRQFGSPFDWGTWREDRGLVPLERFDAHIKQQWWDRRKRHLANFRTDPGIDERPLTGGVPVRIAL
tara:strand:- start:761 stop:1258 length:498 start_codon:yes stop_codon:yes gene_type:complete